MYGEGPDKEVWIALARFLANKLSMQTSQNTAEFARYLSVRLSIRTTVAERLAVTLIHKAAQVKVEDAHNPSYLFAAKHLLGLVKYSTDTKAKIEGLNESPQDLDRAYSAKASHPVGSKVSFLPFDPIRKETQRKTIAARIIGTSRTELYVDLKRIGQPSNPIGNIALAVWRKIVVILDDETAIAALIEQATQSEDSVASQQSGSDANTMPGRDAPKFPESPQRTESAVAEDADIPGPQGSGVGAVFTALFVGREALLEELSESPTQVINLWGMPGVGKTSIAREWSRRNCNSRFDEIVFLEMNGYGVGQAVAPEVACRRLLVSLGVAETEVRSDPELCLDQLDETLRELNALLVLDDVAHGSQVESILRHVGSAHVLVTSRQSLSGLRAVVGLKCVKVDEMKGEEPHELFVKLLGQRSLGFSWAQLDRFVSAGRGLPLALGWIAAALADDPRPLEEIHLGDSILDLGEDVDAERSVRAVFSRFYNDLSPDHKTLLIRIAYAPQRRLHADLTEILGLDLRATTLDLARRSFVVWTERGVTLHDLVREFVLDESREDSCGVLSVAPAGVHSSVEKCIVWQYKRARDCRQRLRDGLADRDVNAILVAMGRFHRDWPATSDCLEWTSERLPSWHWALTDCVADALRVDADWSTLYLHGSIAYRASVAAGATRWRRRIGTHLRQMRIDAIQSSVIPSGSRDGSHLIAKVESLLGIDPFDNWWHRQPVPGRSDALAFLATFAVAPDVEPDAASDLRFHSHEMQEMMGFPERALPEVAMFLFYMAEMARTGSDASPAPVRSPARAYYEDFLEVVKLLPVSATVVRHRFAWWARIRLAEIYLVEAPQETWALSLFMDVREEFLSSQRFSLLARLDRFLHSTFDLETLTPRTTSGSAGESRVIPSAG